MKVSGPLPVLEQVFIDMFRDRADLKIEDVILDVSKHIKNAKDHVLQENKTRSNLIDVNIYFEKVQARQLPIIKDNARIIKGRGNSLNRKELTNKVFEFVKQHPGCKSSQVRNHIPMNHMMWFRITADLINDNKIIRTGKTQSTRYELSR